MSLFHEISEIVFQHDYIFLAVDDNGCLVAGTESGEFWHFNAEVQEEAENIFAIFGVYVH